MVPLFSTFRMQMIKVFVYKNSFMTISFMIPVTTWIMYCQKFSLALLNEDRIKCFCVIVREKCSHLLMHEEELSIQTKLT
jgi:hypothetical protein